MKQLLIRIFSLNPAPSLVRYLVGLIILLPTADFVFDNLNASRRSSEGRMGLALVQIVLILIVTGVIGLLRRPRYGSPKWLQPAWTRLGVVVAGIAVAGFAITGPASEYLAKRAERKARSERFAAEAICYEGLARFAPMERALRRNDYQKALQELRAARTQIEALGAARSTCPNFEENLSGWYERILRDTAGRKTADPAHVAWESEFADFKVLLQPSG